MVNSTTALSAERAFFAPKVSAPIERLARFQTLSPLTNSDARVGAAAASAFVAGPSAARRSGGLVSAAAPSLRRAASSRLPSGEPAFVSGGGALASTAPTPPVPPEAG